MEGFQKATRSAIITGGSDVPSSSFNSSSSSSISASQSDPASLFLTRSPRRAVSLLTCTKLCGVCFVAGIIVGFTLKRRVRRWAAKLLRRIKDD